MMKFHTKAFSVSTACDAAVAGQDTTATAIFKLPVQVFNMLLIWQERATTRASLRDLDGRFLQDVGLSAEQAYTEARKPFWVK